MDVGKITISTDYSMKMITKSYQGFQTVDKYGVKSLIETLTPFFFGLILV